MGFLNYISLNSEFILYFKVNFKSIFYPDNTVDKILSHLECTHGLTHMEIIRLHGIF